MSCVIWRVVWYVLWYLLGSSLGADAILLPLCLLEHDVVPFHHLVMHLLLVEHFVKALLLFFSKLLQFVINNPFDIAVNDLLNGVLLILG